MQLGISFNVFDGLELIKSSLENVRPHAHHINVIYQRVSYNGNTGDPHIEEYLNYLKSKGLIDYIQEYQPKGPGLLHEIRKRALGRKVSLENNCTHYMSKDIDEYYDSQQFTNAMEFIIKNDYDSTACNIQNYYSNPRYQLKEQENFFVPFINSINCQHRLYGDYFCIVDPSRKVVNYNKPYHFMPDELIMHHYSTIRLNKNALIQKYGNRYYTKEEFDTEFERIKTEIEDILNYNPALSEKPQCIEVKDFFNIENSIIEYKQWVAEYQARK